MVIPSLRGTMEQTIATAKTGVEQRTHFHVTVSTTQRIAELELVRTMDTTCFSREQPPPSQVLDIHTLFTLDAGGVGRFLFVPAQRSSYLRHVKEKCDVTKEIILRISYFLSGKRTPIPRDCGVWNGSCGSSCFN